MRGNTPLTPVIFAKLIGGGGGGGGGESTIAWKPAVSADGTISWTRTSSTTKPADQNIKGDDGFSPTVTITPIQGGNRVTITDADGDHEFDVMNGSGVTVDQSYDAASTNAQSGTAVAEAILDKPNLTVYHGKDNKQTAGLEANGKALVFKKPDNAEQIEVNMVADGRAVVNTYVVPTKTYVDDAIPTMVSDLTNDSGYQNATQVQTAINSAIEGITSFDYEVVQALPQTGEKGKIYLVDAGTTGGSVYNEYIWMDGDPAGRFELIGTTEIDLSNYYNKTETDALLDNKADASTVYTKTETDSLLADKADTADIPDVSDLATKAELTSELAAKQDSLVSGTNIKTVANQSLLGSGDVEFKTINNSSISGSGNLTTGRVAADPQSNSISIYEGTDNSVQISKVDNDTIRVQGYGVDDRGATRTLYDMSLANKGYVDAEITNLQGQIDALGETFRVKQWMTNTLDVTIPVCTSDVGNTSIPKLVFTIDDTEGADYQIVGMISYEVFDAASGGNRINCWPVCQFTGNQQKELGVRFMCAGSTDKTAKRISAWVLLKHR